MDKNQHAGMIRLVDIRPTPLVETPGGINSSSGVYGTNCILEKGKNYLIAARSGKGKSTLLHILYGLRKDFTGEYFIDQSSTTDWKVADWAPIRQHRLSMVFQDLRLFPKLTALENLLVKAHLTQTTTKEAILQMANRLEMSPYLDQTAETLSYGQRQRIAIIRALTQPFDLLLLDEPFSHLDDKSRDLTTMLIAEKLMENEAGMILSSLGEGYGFSFQAKLEV